MKALLVEGGEGSQITREVRKTEADNIFAGQHCMIYKDK